MTKSNSHEQLIFPATERNREAILQALRPRLKLANRVLEVASGSGEHMAYFAPRFPNIIWQPSDIDSRHRQSIAAWTSEIDNVLSPIELDAAAYTWESLAKFDLIFCANMIHIAPWNACLGLLAGAAEVLRSGGCLALYGPFMEHGVHTAKSNEQFDQSLKHRNPDWGLRDLSLIKQIGFKSGLKFDGKIEMPANNLTVFFRHRHSSI